MTLNFSVPYVDGVIAESVRKHLNKVIVITHDSEPIRKLIVKREFLQGIIFAAFRTNKINSYYKWKETN